MPRTRPDRMLADKAYSTQKVPGCVAVQRYRGDDPRSRRTKSRVAGCVVPRAVGPRSSIKGSKPDPQSCQETR